MNKFSITFNYTSFQVIAVSVKTPFSREMVESDHSQDVNWCGSYVCEHYANLKMI